MQEALRDVLREQCGVVSRSQLVAAGQRPHDIERLLRRRALTKVQPGVYVDHTGPLTPRQRAWVAVLSCRSRGGGSAESAALAGWSALWAVEGGTTDPKGVFEVVVASERRVDPPNVKVLRSDDVLATSQWHTSPPRVPYEHAVIAVASRQPRTVDVVAELARAVGSRRTTAARLLTCVQTTPRAVRRSLLVPLLDDITHGTCSALEHGYLVGVERAHGLPRARRQERGRSRIGLAYHDNAYDGLLVELDGRVWHESAHQRDRDADRDLLAAVAGRSTLRLTWGQVFDRSCWTAGQIARLLDVVPRRCGPTCTALDS